VTSGERNNSGSDAVQSRIRKGFRMGASKRNRTLESLLNHSKWGEARKLIERDLKKEPENHWLLTQLGVTHYEEGRYRDALSPLESSLKIVPDCPLTLWNLAGTLDAMEKPEQAVPIYTWLLRSKKSAADDPCWESKEWTESLKTDCIYRLGVCFLHLKRCESAEHCFRQYVNLLLAGMNGSYPIEEAACHIREVHKNGKAKVDEVREAINATLQDEGVHSLELRGRKLTDLALPKLSATH
jgi:hypothetical protein